MNEIISFASPALIAGVVILIRSILYKIAPSILEWVMMIIVLSLCLVFSVVGMFAYYGWKDWTSVMQFLTLWIYSTGLVLGIDQTRAVLSNK